MAIAYVANRAAVSGTGGGTTTITFSPASTASAGNLVVGAVGLNTGAARTLNTVTDNSGGGNSWQVDKQVQNGTAEVIAVFSCSLVGSITSATTLTLTFSGTIATKYNVRLEEFSGAATATWLDVTASATGSGTSLTAGTTASAAASDLGVAFWSISSQSTFTQDGSHTAFTTVNQAAGPSNMGEYNVSVSGAQSATGTAGTTGTWAGVQATYKIGHTTTNQTVSQTATVNPSITRSVGKIISLTSTVNPSLAASKTKSQTVSQTATVNPSMVRQVGKIVVQTVTVTPSLVKQIAKTVSLTVTGAPSLVKSVAKTLAVASTVAPTLTAGKQANQTVAQTVTVTPTLTTHRATVFQQALTVTVTVTGTIRRCISRFMGGDSPGTLTMIGDDPGTLSASTDTPGTLTLTPDSPGSLSLTQDDPGSLGTMEPGCR